VDKALPDLLMGETTLEAVMAAYPEQAEALRPLLESVLWVQARQPDAGLGPGYLETSRLRLIAAIAHQPISKWHQFWRRPTPQRFAVQSFSFVLLIFSFVMVLNSLFLAARLAIPGDFLYPTKLGFEAVQLALTLDPPAAARLQIEFTQHRTGEIVQLVLLDDYLHLPATVNRLEVQIDRAVADLDSLQVTDAAKAVELARSLEKLLTNETFIMSLLRETEPAFTYAGLNQAIQATTSGLTALQD